MRSSMLPIAVLALFLSTLVGCGGGSTPEPVQPVARQAKPAAPVVVANGGVAQPAAAVPGQPAQPNNAGQRNQPKTPVTPVPAGADPNDLMEIVEEADVFEIVPTSEIEENDDAVEITELPEGTTADTYVFSGTPSAATGSPRPDLRVPPNFRVRPEFGFDEQGFPRRIQCVTDGSQMVLVPPGNFWQGTDDGPKNAAPRHSVFVDRFYIDLHEVTVGQYTAFRNTLGDNEKRLARPPLNAEANPRMPVEGVRFSDATAYAKWCGKELPTEAEWEKAARGSEGEVPWGRGRTFFSRARERDDVDPVMSFPQDVSPYGAWDMAGNVREWCTDWYEPDAYQKAFDRGETFSNWAGPGQPGPDYLRVAKGNGPGWFAWHREGLNSTEQIPGVGFRCVVRGQRTDRTASR